MNTLGYILSMKTFFTNMIKIVATMSIYLKHVGYKLSIPSILINVYIYIYKAFNKRK